MGRISTGIGLVSGINTADIINQLMSLEERPKTLLQGRIDNITKQKTAYTDLQTKFASIRLRSQVLKKISTFNTATATSNNENVLTATTAPGASVGSFQFQVARLVTAQQSVSKGFADYDANPVGAATMTLEMGGGELRTTAQLAQLNGGAGIRRGMFRITDRSGKSAVIDTSAAVTLDDVVKKINSALDVSVKAEIGPDGLKLTDLSGGGGSFAAQDLAGGHSAEDLGIAKSVAGSTLSGSAINTLGRDTLLSQLNDGRGVNVAGTAVDFTIHGSDGASYDVNLGSVRTIGQVLDKLNALGAGKFNATLAPDGKSLQIQDAAGGGATLSVTAGASTAASDLGILGSAVGTTLDGAAVLSELDTVSLTSLRGGTGLNLGTVSFTNRAGASATVDFAGSTTVRDILERINGAGLNLTASLKDSLNGIQIVDNSAGTGALSIADVGSTTATELGIAGTFDLTTVAVRGANLQRQWVTRNALLSTYNGGRGVTPGTFRITNAAGTAATIDLTNAANMNIGQVIDAINARNMGVTASINANGDGLLLTDTSGGAGKLKVEDINGNAAANLRLAGTATGTSIDGSFEVTIDVTATDKLADVQKKIAALGFGASANIINDGSTAAPYRLSLTAFNSGLAGRVVFDSGAANLGVRTLVEAQDAAVFLGGANAERPLLVTAGRNQLSGVIPGVTIDLHGVSNGPVDLNVSRSAENVVQEIQGYVDGFNEIVDKLNALTQFDADTKARGLLLGSSSVQRIQNEMYASMTAVVAGVGRYKMLADVGITLGEGAKMQFDEEKFRAAFGTDPEAVKNLFTATASGTDASGKTVTTEKGLGYLLESHLNKLIDPVLGVIPRENKNLDSRTDQFQDRIDALGKLLEQKRLRLEKQFANMEKVLAGLQTQQQALGQLQLISYTSDKK